MSFRSVHADPSGIATTVRRYSMKPDKVIADAIESLAIARNHFQSARSAGLVLGNDNHIGDLGEYWVMKHLKNGDRFKRYAQSKISPYDIELTDGSRVSVKTITSWSEAGLGTQVKPLCGTKWSILAAVLLDKDLKPCKIAWVPLQVLVTKEPFVSNERRRRENGTKSYPRFEWWEWLNEFLVYTRA